VNDLITTLHDRFYTIKKVGLFPRLKILKNKELQISSANDY